MGVAREFVRQLHTASKRNYLSRMLDDKVHCMQIASKYDSAYWDGERRYGYGGYHYLEGRWKGVANALINTYKLSAGSKVLDVGCGKGFLLHEMLLLEPGLQIVGFDISGYAINCATELVKPYLHTRLAESVYPWTDKEFDLVISLGALHNLRIFDLKLALTEIERVAKKGYIMTESYRNEQELFNLQCWALTCKSFFDEREWVSIYQYFGYSGDYEFIYFE